MRTPVVLLMDRARDLRERAAQWKKEADEREVEAAAGRRQAEEMLAEADGCEAAAKRLMEGAGD